MGVVSKFKKKLQRVYLNNVVICLSFSCKWLSKRKYKAFSPGNYTVIFPSPHNTPTPILALELMCFFYYNFLSILDLSLIEVLKFGMEIVIKKRNKIPPPLSILWWFGMLFLSKKKRRKGKFHLKETTKYKSLSAQPKPVENNKHLHSYI